MGCRGPRCPGPAVPAAAAARIPRKMRFSSTFRCLTWSSAARCRSQASLHPTESAAAHRLAATISRSQVRNVRCMRSMRCVRSTRCVRQSRRQLPQRRRQLRQRRRRSSLPSIP